MKDIDLDYPAMNIKNRACNYGTELMVAVHEYIKFIASNDYNADRVEDYENAIFEAAVNIFYDENIWDFINEKIDNE